VPNWLLLRPELSLGAKLVYGRLAQYAGRRGYAYPLMKTLGRAVGVSERQARRYVSELKNHGLLDTVDYSETNRPSRYYFLSHHWMYEEEVHETTLESAGDQDQEENDQELQSDSEDLTHPPDTYDRTPRTHMTGPPGQMCPPEESQGRESEKETQGSALRRPIPETPPSGPPSKPQDTEYARPPDMKRDCQVGRSVPVPSVAELGAVVKAAQAEADDAARIKAAKKKAAAERRQRYNEQRKENRKNEQRATNLQGNGLNGSKLTPEQRKRLKKCEGLWLSGMRARWPDATFAAWSGKERGQCTKLLKLYPGDLVGQALSYVITNWDAIKERLFRGKGSFPTVGMVLRLHDVLVPEAETLGKALAVRDEYKQWFKDNPNSLYPPDDLEARYNAVKPDLEALGLE